MEAKPKYRITSTPKDRDLPSEQRFATRKGDLETICKSMQAESPAALIEVRMQVGLRRGFPMRWRWTGQSLEPTNYYDQLATSRRPLTAKQLATLHKDD